MGVIGVRRGGGGVYDALKVCQVLVVLVFGNT